ncbi:MAG: hypothetical protein V4658_08090, partial [Bacteroidota bacterium]
MRNKGLILTTIVFFLTVNTIYYWEVWLGLFAIPAYLLVFIVFLGLVIAFIRQVYLSIKERFTDTHR